MNSPALSRYRIDLDTGCRQFVHLPSLLREAATEVFAVSDRRRVLLPLTSGVTVGPEMAASRAHVSAPFGTGNLYRLSSSERQFLGQLQSWEERYQAGKAWYLGRTGATSRVALFITDDELAGIAEHTETSLRLIPLRQVGAFLNGQDAAIATHATCLALWHLETNYCSRCATRLEIAAAGWELHCPRCGDIVYPRQDPSVIVAISDEADRLLLAHNSAWENNFYSVIAGYVEAGESLEGAVHREVGEEVGLEVDEVRYLTSQPWPYPRSLMLGFSARCRTPYFILDEAEIDRALWVSRAEFMELVASRQISPPGPSTIASNLIENWLGCPIIRPEDHNL
ncbi:NAD(+) diphosphatase [Varibaculum cambriense]|nr:NAD(+) diphosphatase [Varibaculum cambriense]